MKKVFLLITLLSAVVLVCGCMTVSMYTTVDKTGAVNHMKTEIEVSRYVYDLLEMSVQSEGYASMQDYFLTNLSKQYGQTGVTATYSEEKTEDNVKMTVDLRGTIQQDAESGMAVTRDGDYMVFRYGNPDTGSVGEYTNMSGDTSGMTDTMLNGIKFNYYLEMPGRIVDSNAGTVSGNKAEWHFTGKNVTTMGDLYARSEIAKSPGFEAAIALVALAAGIYLFAAGKKE